MRHLITYIRFDIWQEKGGFRAIFSHQFLIGPLFHASFCWSYPMYITPVTFILLSRTKNCVILFVSTHFERPGLIGEHIYYT